LEIARQEALRRHLPALFRTEQLSDLQEEGVYDLVYSRFLLTHLAKPERAIERLVGAARPGGAVVVEDIEFAAHFSYPVCPAFRRCRQCRILFFSARPQIEVGDGALQSADFAEGSTASE
jgi:2-polyprenyl-3-methyl-5-hydroxy-6-metoxy-1,4-benzoquinol methylase